MTDDTNPRLFDLAEALPTSTAVMLADGDTCVLMLHQADVPQAIADQWSAKLRERLPGIAFVILPGVSALAVHRPTTEVTVVGPDDYVDHPDDAEYDREDHQ